MDRIDPLCEKFYNVSPYAYCHNNPALRIDTDGKWDITVHLSEDRSKNGYGVAVLTDNEGTELYKFVVRGEGSSGHDRYKDFGDTPTGVYDIPNNCAWMSGGSRASYGPNHRLVMVPKSGEIVATGRNLFRMHGGRQETKDKNGNWIAIENPELIETNGCLRASEADMITLKSMTDFLQKDDKKERPGVVTVKDDLDPNDSPVKHESEKK